MMEQKIWSEFWRPKKVDDCILPERIKTIFKKFVEQKEMPNLLLSSTSPGTGKTTVARALCNELGYDVLFINASENGNIDTLRTTMRDFCSTVSMSASMKCVILDEADFLTPVTQSAMRGFMEEFSKSCRFILTCNFKDRIIEPLQSRSAGVDFDVKEGERKQMMVDFLRRLVAMLEHYNVSFDRKVVAEHVKNHFPDMRRTINQLQQYAVGGVVDTGILALGGNVDFENLVAILKEKNYTKLRQWASNHKDASNQQIFRSFYDEASKLLTPDTIPNLVLLIGEYQYKEQFVADKEINLVAFLTEAMCSLSFK